MFRIGIQSRGGKLYTFIEFDPQEAGRAVEKLVEPRRYLFGSYAVYKTIVADH